MAELSAEGQCTVPIPSMEVLPTWEHRVQIILHPTVTAGQW